jgi:signal transduction histidine kinase
VFSATIGGTPLEVVASPIRSGTTLVGTYIASSDLQPFVAERSRVLALSLAEAGVALLVGVASAFFLLRRLLRTIGEITKTAEEIGNGDLDQRLGDQGSSDEVAELARTFDAMLDHLEAAMSGQRRLLSDVSHQLRTPLTVVRGHLEVLARSGTADRIEVGETLALVIDELDHMTVLIERLLMLGRAMEPDLLRPSPIELAEFLAAIVDSVAVIAPRQFILAPMSPLVVTADREQLRGAIVNLLDNAIHATSDEDPIAIGAQLDPASEMVQVLVEDSGAGIPPSQREAALQRFFRPGARDSDGSGLGLAIAKAVATAHGGSISIDQSPTLGGARVAIIIPMANLPATSTN